MRNVTMIVGLSMLALAACGDDDDTIAAGGGTGGAAGHNDSGHGGTSLGGKGGKGGTGDAAGSGDKGGSGGSNSGDHTVTIRFKGTVGSEAFDCSKTYANVGTQNTTIQPTDFRFFVQDLALIDDKGQEVPVQLETRGPWQSKDVALIDFENATGTCGNGSVETNTEIVGTVPKGNYNGIVFSNGVPESLNHADPTTVSDPLKTYANLSWGWLFGYRFLIGELVVADGAAAGDVDAGEPIASWLHLGSTECSNQSLEDGGVDFAQPPISCARANRNKIRLDNYKIAESVIVADLAGIFANSDVSVSQGCHGSGEACPPLWSGVGLDQDGQALTTQRVYRLE